jgi:hypothetical protein
MLIHTYWRLLCAEIITHCWSSTSKENIQPTDQVRRTEQMKYFIIKDFRILDNSI